MNAAKLRRPGITAFLLLTALFFILISTSCKISPKPPDRYALVYGIGSYEQVGYGNLGSTIDDAESVAQVLENKGFTDVYLRLDEGDGNDIKEATITQFKSDIENIGSNNITHSNI